MQRVLAVVMRTLLGAALLVALSAQRPSSGPPVDLQLALAVDVSGSVSQERFELQKQGYAAAFRNPRVLAAIQSGSSHAIAVTLFQWTGPWMQVHAVRWMRIEDEESALALAAAIEGMPRGLYGGGTSISGAIDYAMTLFPDSPFAANRKVIDISGDGSNNRGRPVQNARDEAVRAGAVINGLPILVLEPELDRYYENNVVGGPGAFVVPAKSYETFAQAILQKLIVEISSRGAPLLAKR